MGAGVGSGLDGPTGSKKQHVAFPGGRMEPGDEGEMYTGEFNSDHIALLPPCLK